VIVIVAREVWEGNACFGSSLDGHDSDTFCISATVHLVSADDTHTDESCSGEYIATYVTYDTTCRGNNVVVVSDAAAAEDTKWTFFCSVYFCLDHCHYTHCYPELL